VVSAVISPLLGLILVLVMPNLKTERLLRTQHADMMRAMGHELPPEIDGSYRNAFIILAIIGGMLLIGFYSGDHPSSRDVGMTKPSSTILPQRTPETEAFAAAIRKRDAQK
jgi:hypothetical protein